MEANKLWSQYNKKLHFGMTYYTRSVAEKAFLAAIELYNDNICDLVEKYSGEIKCNPHDFGNIYNKGYRDGLKRLKEEILK